MTPTLQILNEDPGMRAIYQCVEYINDAENLALIIQGRDSVKRAIAIMKKYRYSYPDIARLNYSQLCKEGLSRGQALALIAAFNQSARRAAQETESKIQIKSSTDVATIMKPLIADLPHEEFWIILVNRSNRAINKIKISQGGISGTVTDVRLIMKVSLENLASGIIACHNHPSGNTEPSDSDKKITSKMNEAAGFLDITLLDHIIIAGDKHFSFADEGLI